MSPRQTGMSLVMVETGCTDVVCMEDFSDLYQAGLALEQILGRESKFTEGFNPDRDAHAQEKAKEIRFVYRPGGESKAFFF